MVSGSDVLQETLEAFCRRHHPCKLSLFGSSLREFGPESALAILVFDRVTCRGLPFSEWKTSRSCSGAPQTSTLRLSSAVIFAKRCLATHRFNLERDADAVRSQHLLDAARKAVAATARMQRSGDQDEILALALVRLEIIREAANTCPNLSRFASRRTLATYGWNP